jgi:hypothetical protein
MLIMKEVYILINPKIGLLLPRMDEAEVGNAEEQPTRNNPAR